VTRKLGFKLKTSSLGLQKSRLRNCILYIFSGYTYSKEYYKDGGYICPSDIFYGR
jgi:hypothetical protein